MTRARLRPRESARTDEKGDISSQATSAVDDSDDRFGERNKRAAREGRVNGHQCRRYHAGVI